MGHQFPWIKFLGTHALNIDDALPMHKSLPQLVECSRACKLWKDYITCEISRDN